MTDPYDGGIVNAYVDSLLLGITHQNGRRMVGRAAMIVRRAMTHLDEWPVGDPALNKARFVSQLKMHADLAAPVAAVKARALKKAHLLAAAILQSTGDNNEATL